MGGKVDNKGKQSKRKLQSFGRKSGKSVEKQKERVAEFWCVGKIRNGVGCGCGREREREREEGFWCVKGLFKSPVCVRN